MKPRVIATLILSLCILFAQAQNADAILAKYFKQKGGQEKWAAIKTMKMEIKMSSNGQELSMIVFTKSLAKRIETHVQGVEIITVCDGKETWMLSPALGKDPVKLNEEQAESFTDNPFDDDFADYKKKGYEVVLMGSEELDGLKCFKLKLLKKKGSDKEEDMEIHFIDAETYAEVMDITYEKDEAGKILEIKTYSGDFHEVNGLTFPFFMESKANGQTLQKITIEKITLDEPMEDSLFTFAKK